MSFFEMASMAKPSCFQLTELNSSSISVLFLDEDADVDFSGFSIFMCRVSREITVQFVKDFSYYQASNFEKFFSRVLKYTVEHGDCKLCDYSILKKAEVISLRHNYDFTHCDYNENRLVLEDFYYFLVSTPLKECIIYRNHGFTYRDIEEQANQIANLLCAHGMCHGAGVVLYMDRSEKIMSSILAVMKCGGFYIPVDISTPVERLKKIIHDAHPRIILVDGHRAESLQESCGDEVINIERAQDYNITLDFKRIPLRKEDACYMIYTSGTTGNPKGVLIKNCNIANFISNNILVKQAQGIDDPCIVAANKIGFDAFVGDMLLSISAGFKIVMASSEELENSNLFVQAIKSASVNIIQTTPTRLNLSVLNYYPEVIKRFRIIACGGEPFGTDMITKISRYAPKVVLINLYGPTETTVWSTAANISEGQKGIGWPQQNTQCYILNRFQKFMPRYETGILYIGGDGLGCYCFDKQAQREKFVKVEGIEDEVYNSGDTAYIDESNYIIYGARADSQVKINGVRIELAEIEAVAKKSGLIKDCAVAVKEIPEIGHRLVLYFTSDVTVDRNALQAAMSELPETYKPSYYVYLKEIPLTLSSKIDRRSLPLPQIEMSDEIIAPRTKCERDLFRICTRIKPTLGFGVTQILRDMGFDSLGMMELIMEMEDEGYHFPESIYRSFQSTETIESLASKIESHGAEAGVDYSLFPKRSFEGCVDNNEYNTVLLTGASGFLGAHILAELLQSTKCRIICLSHRASIKEKFAAYKFSSLFDESRVLVLHGDLYRENFGLSDDDYERLDSVEAIINCAALVKYFGDADAFRRSNILSVRNLVDFSERRNIVLNHISTLSVLGSESLDVVDEHAFYVGQDEVFNNQYIESKFQGEYEIIKRNSDFLKYRILRIGRLAWREGDSVFQPNCDENEFYSILKLFWVMKKIPEEIIDMCIEISPIEYCAKAIIKLTRQKFRNGTFHIMNENSVSIRTIIHAFEMVGCSLNIVSMTEFMEAFKNLTGYDSLKQLIQMCCIREGKLLIEHNNMITNELTSKMLKDSQFSWPRIEEEYFTRFFRSQGWDK